MTSSKIPLYIKFSQVILGITALFYIIYIGGAILKPLVFAAFISILLDPVVKFLQRRGVNHIVAIMLSVFATLLVLVGLMYFIISQITPLADDMPEIKKNMALLVDDIFNWISQTFNVRSEKITAFIQQAKENANSGNALKETIVSAGSVISVLVLMPVYIFLTIYYKQLFLKFIGKLFPIEKHAIVQEIMEKCKKLIQQYLSGLLIEFVIVAVLTAVSLLIIGVKSAILFGVIAAMLNLIPYIGILVALLLPVIMSFSSGQPIDALWVVVAFIIVQFIDNNIIVPRIVASKVRINALASIVVTIIGGAIWGIAGMFIAIPAIAVAKVVFDHIPQLEPLGYLLGDDTEQKPSRLGKLLRPKNK